MSGPSKKARQELRDVCGHYEWFDKVADAFKAALVEELVALDKSTYPSPVPHESHEGEGENE